MPNKELDREFRVLNQTLSIHTLLRDKYNGLALILDLSLLACSVIFCATTFAGDDFYSKIGLLPETGRLVLGIASILAFSCSIISLRVNWKGKGANHSEAVKKLSDVAAQFRKEQHENGAWTEGIEENLHNDYWNAMNNIVEIPANKFNKLKAKHLKKVEISKMISSSPGCPIFLMNLVLTCRSIKKFFSK